MTTDGHAALPDTQTESSLERMPPPPAKQRWGFASKAKSLRMDVIEGSGFLHPWVSSEATISETVYLFSPGYGGGEDNAAFSVPSSFLLAFVLHDHSERKQ